MKKQTNSPKYKRVYGYKTYYNKAPSTHVPKPQTIQYRKVGIKEKWQWIEKEGGLQRIKILKEDWQWVNVCPYCKSTQGNYFIYKTVFYDDNDTNHLCWLNTIEGRLESEFYEEIYENT